ncbi:MAG: T9SS type A sorting domain-containing protein [Bacteroidota bacterium]
MKQQSITLFALFFLATFQLAAQDLPIDPSKYHPLPLPNPTESSHDSLTGEELYLVTESKWSDTRDSMLVGESDEAHPAQQSIFPGYNPFKDNNDQETIQSQDTATATAYVFSNLEPADRINGFPNYPFSAVVKINIAYEDDWGVVTYGTCSGAMVGPRHVITAGHCVIDPQKNKKLKFGPGSVVIPAYNMGNVPFGYAQITTWLSFNGWTNNSNWNYDVALLVLDRDIGNLVGWLGLGYNENESWFLDSWNTHSSIGYPGSDDFGNPVFEAGERMYAMQGYMDWFESFNSTCHNNLGFRGQSGSGLYYRDNNDRYVLGVLSHGNGTTPPYHTCHTVLDERMFDTILDKIRETTVSSSEGQAPTEVQVFPNPTNDLLHIQFPQSIQEPTELAIFNAQGILLARQRLPEGQRQFTYSIGRYAKGLYVVQLRSASSERTFKVLRQ